MFGAILAPRQPAFRKALYQPANLFLAPHPAIFTGATTSIKTGSSHAYTIAVYSPGGQKLGLYTFGTGFINNQQTNYQTEAVLGVTGETFLYFAGRLLTPLDRLGSNRYGSNYDYFPWGEQKGTGNPQDTWNFATYWADSLTGLDYAMNRYYSNAYGLFMTPDPYQASVGPADPGSWNRYAYTRGDPTNRNDVSGLCDSGDPSCVSQCDPADPICVNANSCDPADASCSLGSTGGGTGGSPSYSPTSATYALMDGSVTVGSLTINFGTGASTFQFGNVILTVPFSAVTSLPAAPAGGYWAYLNCFWTGMLGATMKQPEIPGVSILAMFSGLITGAAWGPGVAVVGFGTITVDLFNKENQVAQACAKQTGYTPWILQN